MICNVISISITFYNTRQENFLLQNSYRKSFLSFRSLVLSLQGKICICMEITHWSSRIFCPCKDPSGHVSAYKRCLRWVEKGEYKLRTCFHKDPKLQKHRSGIPLAKE